MDPRSLDAVQEEYFHLLLDSIQLRFRSDVPVGVNVSGGLDSAVLLALVRKHLGNVGNLKAFTFTCGDERYDELPWVRHLLTGTDQPLVDCQLVAADVPELAASVQFHQDEPFGGMATIAYANLFQIAREHGVIVLLEGQGMDEQWAG